MANKVIDLSVYQNKAKAYFDGFHCLGVKSAMVKLTEATGYVNSSASEQVANAYKTFGTVGAYHFFHGYGIPEAKYFLAYVRHFGLDKSTVLAIDVEWQGLPYDTTHEVNVFLKYLIDHGYKHVVTYGSASWFNSGRIKRSLLIDKHIWVAAYGTSQPGVADADAWQYTDNFHGVDCSLDFDGILSGVKSTAVDKPSYNKIEGLYEVLTSHLYAYRTKGGHLKRRDVVWVKGSRFYAKPVKTKKGYILKTALGYVSAKTEYTTFVKKAGD